MEVLSRVPVVWLMVLVSGSYASFSPNITIKSCSSSSVVVRLTNAGSGGLVYIQGGGPACSRTTASDTSEYTFDFGTCGLQYDRKFRVVVQQRPHWQTGDDKVIPVMCFVDTSALVVTGVIYPEETSNEAVNKTVKPTVRMSIQAEGSDDYLSEVTLNDNVKMIMKLDAQYLRDFDIKAKDCTAAFIPVVTDECSSDEELFPNFDKSQKGVLTTNFNAFQPTNLDVTEDVDVTFTCNVAVCKGKCEKTVCGEIVGWGRKKRDDHKDDIIERVTIGTKVRVKSPHTEEAHAAIKGSTYCAQKVIVTTVTSMTAVILIFSWLLCGCIFSKLVRLKKKQHKPKKANPLRRLSEMNANIARSVGRRVSTIFNIPFGYDMNDPKMMDRIPEFDPTPPQKRRESVTVSTNEHSDTDAISASSSCACVLRRRLVSSCYQTSSDFENGDDSMSFNVTPSVLPVSLMSHIRSNNSITSLSIKSNIRSGYDVACAVNNEKVNSQNDSVKSSTEDADTRKYYTADELPTNREIGLEKRAIRGTDISLAKSRSINNNANTTVINIGNPDIRPRPKSNPPKAIISDIATSAKDDNMYADIDSMQDVFEVASDSADRWRTPVGVRHLPVESGGRRGSASSVFNSFISSSKKTIGRVADALTSLPNKDRFDLDTGSLVKDDTRPTVISVRRESIDIQASINEKGDNDQNDHAKNWQNGANLDDENVYEPIYFGDQLKTGRKFSTHV